MAWLLIGLLNNPQQLDILQHPCKSDSWGGEGWPTPISLHMRWITNILQEVCPWDQITEAVVLAPGEAILFIGRHSCKEGLLYRNAQDIELGLKGQVNWAGRTVQIEAAINIMQESHWAIVWCYNGEENKDQRVWVPPKIKVSHLVLSCHL